MEQGLLVAQDPGLAAILALELWESLGQLFAAIQTISFVIMQFPFPSPPAYYTFLGE
jgi:hypothetical protein